MHSKYPDLLISNMFEIIELIAVRFKHICRASLKGVLKTTTEQNIIRHVVYAFLSVLLTLSRVSRVRKYGPVDNMHEFTFTQLRGEILLFPLCTPRYE